MVFSKGWLCIRLHCSISVCLRLFTAGWYVVTKGKILSLAFFFCAKADGLAAKLTLKGTFLWLTLFSSKRSLMCFWTKEASPNRIRQIHDGRHCTREAAQSTIPFDARLPLRRKRLGEGVVKVETENWEMRLHNCKFAVVECQLWLLNC